jgi:hypothetical protein
MIMRRALILSYEALSRPCRPLDRSGPLLIVRERAYPRVVASATEDVFQALQQVHARGEALSVAQIVEALGAVGDEDDVRLALEHLRDEGVAVEDVEGCWSLHSG